ncbi:hypothetical protein XA68_12989 [Ophiocordyceps unilateralis]|uniref:Uncharacterized protein n=1 Tax=Ophiocordyceps unilateralis TaxID=268505 RepID=A0A2A9PMH8_OPHUN|nr:hypothetical protein XA68_12989 [Ophiocordyceps unilateralis]
MSFSGQSPRHNEAKSTLSSMFRRCSRRSGADEKQQFFSETGSVTSRSSGDRDDIAAAPKPLKSKKQSKTPKLPTLVMPPIRYYN